MISPHPALHSFVRIRFVPILFSRADGVYFCTVGRLRVHCSFHSIGKRAIFQLLDNNASNNEECLEANNQLLISTTHSALILESTAHSKSSDHCLNEANTTEDISLAISEHELRSLIVVNTSGM
jgi:hypothetical protein